jgi:uncharacterized protein YidB (DUF937 family)
MNEQEAERFLDSFMAATINAFSPTVGEDERKEAQKELSESMPKLLDALCPTLRPMSEAPKDGSSARFPIRIRRR